MKVGSNVWRERGGSEIEEERMEWMKEGGKKGWREGWMEEGRKGGRDGGRNDKKRMGAEHKGKSLIMPDRQGIHPL